MSGLSIIIPSRNASNLESCVFSVVAHEKPCPRIIVVDDGLKYSNPEQKQFIASHTQIVGGQKPFIFARNCNIGIHMAGDDDVILMNDDCMLKSHGGFTMLKIMSQTHTDFGVIASSCDNVGNVRQHRIPNNVRLREEERMVCFICVLIPRSTINQIGVLDEQYVDYGMDDDDYCWTARQAGLKIGIFDGCYVDHSSLKPTFRSEGKGDFHPNLKRFIEKWGHDNFGRKVE